MRKLVLAATAAVLLAAGLAIPATAEPLPATVSITVKMDLKGYADTDGPIIYQVTDVPVGDGPELSGDDLVDNPSNWCGSLFVDVDNVAKTITIEPDEPCNFGIAAVVVEGEGIDALSVVTDDLWDNAEVPNCTMALTDADAAAGVATIVWQVPDDQVDPDTCYSADMLAEGIAVFAYGEAEPTTTTEQTTTTTTAPTTTTAKAAPAAVAAPRFTG